MRLARLGMSLLLLAALLLGPLAHVPIALAAPGFTVNPTSGLVTTEAGGTATFTIRLNQMPTADVTIGLSSNDTTEGTVSPASFTFTSSNWNTNQTATVTGVDDALDDGSVSYTIITAPAVSADAGYNNLNPANVNVTNTDNDTAGITVSGISGNTTESGGTATFSIVLTSQPTADVTIGLSSSDTTEGTVSPTSLTFTSANWNTPQIGTVTGVNDSVDDGDIAYTIITAQANSADNDYDNMNPANVSVTNIDDDTAGITVSAVSGNTTEAGGTATFTVKLNSQPTANVTIGLSSNDTTEGTVSPTSLTFTSVNWNTNQTVTATGVNDAIDDGDIAYAIVTAAATSSDSKYNGLNAADANLFNIDDDSVGIIVSNISGNTTEAGGTATFTVKLASQPSANVTIGLSSSDTTEGTVSLASLTFTTVNWNTNQTVTVTGVNDAVDDGDVAYSIVTAAATSTDTGYSGLNAADVSVVNTDDDTAGITVSAISGNTTEAGGTATFTVKLNSQPTADVTIDLSSSDPNEGTVNPTSLTFTSANWNTNQVVTVSGVDDNIDDGNIAYSIVTAPASSADSVYDGRNAADVAVTNTDDDTAGITVSGISGNTSESGGTATFTVVLNSQPTADVTIDLSSSNTGEGTVAPASLTFTSGNWNTPQSVTVTGVDDDVDDGDINYTIVTAPAASGDSNYNNRDAANVGVVNHDDDTAGITVSGISGNTTESGGTAIFTVVLDSQPTANVTIDLSSSNTDEGTVAPASLTFTSANWDTPQTVTVTGVDDPVDDDDIPYTIIIADATSADPNYSGLDADDISLSNIDNDGAGIIVSAISGHTTEAGGTATFTVKLASQPTANVAIGLSSSDPNEGTVGPTSLTFTSANWNTAQTVTITGVDDDVDDGDINYTIILAAATSSDPKYSGENAADAPVTNDDDDTAGLDVSSSGDTTEAGGTATFTVKLTSKPTANVTIGLSSSDSNEGTVSPASLTFTNANWNTPQTVTITGIDDEVDDGDVAYTIITAPASSADGNYDNLNAADVSLNNVDDDTAGITVSGISGDTGESGGTATFTVKLASQPIADVAIQVSSSNIAEGTISPGVLTFTNGNWNTPQTVTVTGVDDDVDDGDINYTILTAPATSTDGNYNGRDAADVNVVNVDDDTAGITVSAASNNTTEAGGAANFTVVLSSQPTANVTIGLSSSNIAEGTVSPASLTFTSANWNTPQTVDITGVDDATDDGDVAYAIVTAPATSADTVYNGLDADDVSLSNIDNDGAGVVVSTISGDTTEAGGTATFTVTLATQPTAAVTITLSTDNPAEGTVSPASLTFTNSNWNVPQTVTVTGVDDSVDDGDIAYSIVLAPAVSTDPAYSGEDAADLSAINLDDDIAGIAVSAISGNTTEAGGTATFTVKLNSQPTANVTIGLSSSDTTEGTVSPASLTFTSANWNTPRIVTVKGVNDQVDDNNIAYSIITAPASSADAKYDLLNAGDVGLSNIDDDTAGVTVSASSRHTSEAGRMATFTIRLNSQPEADVSITLSSSDLTEGTVAPTLLTFTSANWNTPQTVTVTGVDDTTVDGNITYKIITGPASSADSTYNGRTVADVTVVNDDNDPGTGGNKTFLYLPLIRR